MRHLKLFIDELKAKIPVSVSELNYRDHKTFIGIMFGIIGFLLGKTFYISALALMGVYAFRYFHRKNQRFFHYMFAIIAFAMMGVHSGVYWPLIVGSVLFLINKIKKTDKHVFWFEMGAGIPYLFLI